MSKTIDFLGESAPIQQLKHLALQVAQTDVTVLITGETGSGKEVLSRFIHGHSRRSHKNFIPVNCGAIPTGILESELFGHEKGAFTGAIQSRKGYFESANQGTIFLDEIGEMPLETQVKLLRVIETGEFQRVGSSETIHTDARLVAATNKNLQQAVAAKSFREDLYFRLHSVELHLPPLRERGKDILILAEHFIRHLERKHTISFEGFTNDAVEMLLRYNWPGNVRELKNLLESLLILEKGKQITSETLDRHLVQRSRDKGLVHDPEKSEKNELNLIYNSLIRLHQEINEVKQLLQQKESSHEEPSKKPLLLPPPLPEQRESLASTEDTLEPINKGTEILPLEAVEKQAIAEALEAYDGNKRQTAKTLGINERTLYRKIRKYRLDRED
ncbi:MULTISPECIES: sigma-54 interaction domain-containing protein [unclassified Prosthecochloris]|uniref:sigma-54 interaction domain-containing protein n=1 Tax=unclassified Prosthecochloris TaxID=2632826 RepID=UPI00223DC958|nr:MULTISPECIES: sigma-54 dependent transcriptional regulator [unclassified Prosthecochloris]UZJ36806.1 sigma-54 dependent transcriptional regulator [Prosthecochloris sp. SCSIO W1103]UZJ39746.1 sigma-54 dependent transcriptional regulator [Prosthecochloris sp. SCSIO W1102]